MRVKAIATAFVLFLILPAVKRPAPDSLVKGQSWRISTHPTHLRTARTVTLYIEASHSQGTDSGDIRAAFDAFHQSKSFSVVRAGSGADLVVEIVPAAQEYREPFALTGVRALAAGLSAYPSSQPQECTGTVARQTADG